MGRFNITADGITESMIYPTDIFLFSMDRWNNEDLAMEMQIFCEEEEPGQIYEIGDCKIEIIERYVEQ